jgi:cytochrome c5
MTMSSKFLIYALAAATAAITLLQAAGQGHQPAVQTSKKQAPITPVVQQVENEGDRIFQHNCARCHTTPEGFSPRISGTIVRHMRVRASLSKHDEEELLRFLNP